MIVQIMPAPLGWRVVFMTDMDTYNYEDVVMWALVDDQIMPCTQHSQQEPVKPTRGPWQPDAIALLQPGESFDPQLDDLDFRRDWIEFVHRCRSVMVGEHLTEEEGLSLLECEVEATHDELVEEARTIVKTRTAVYV